MSRQHFLIHTHTPVISVQDPRGLAVRTLQFQRRAVEEAAQVWVTQQIFDAMGRPVANRDPRLFALAQGAENVPANLVSLFSLSGAVLFSNSVDAGWRLGLYGEAGQALERWDGREAHSVMAYDELLRPVTITEQAQLVERFNYAAADSQAAEHNLCGQLMRHDDPAGSQLFEQYSIGGAVLQGTRRFLQAIEVPDWPLAEAARDELLEPLPGAVTRYATNPWTEAIGQIDAQGNVQRLAMTCAGALRSSYLQLAGQAEQLLVSDIRYNAFGQVEAETAGNGVQTRNIYDPATGQLQRLTADKADGTALQDLNYEYDPLGNILRIEDAAQPIHYFRNQAIEAISTYRYDTLYQLIEASGREALGAVSGPQLPPFQSPADPNQLANYSQRYDYDAGGNLQNLSHIGGQHYTREMITARFSNRSLPVIDDHIPDEAELAAAFDANGNLLELQRGQALIWDLRNQLQQVTPVQREDAEDDYERYIYDGSGQRLRKVCITQAANISHRAEVRYLPGLEVRTATATGETLHVIIAPAGRCEVRVLHWQQGQPDGISNDQQRYSLSDHLGSSTLELDDGANIISQESYYPFGGTCWWAGRSAIEANYKTVRYSGKERDASGLYYYGFRYYAPWLFRWLNPDPAGAVDGLNLFAMAGNSPVCRRDPMGLSSNVPKHVNWVWLGKPLPQKFAMNINDFMSRNSDYQATLWVDNRSWASGHGQALENVGRSVNVRNVEDLFLGNMATVRHAFERERSGPLKNYAAASDIARAAALSRGGGLYLDVDIEVRAGSSSLGTLSAPAGFLIDLDQEGMMSNGLLAATDDTSVINKFVGYVDSQYRARNSATWAEKRRFPTVSENKANEAREGLAHNINALNSRILLNRQMFEYMSVADKFAFQEVNAPVEERYTALLAEYNQGGFVEPRITGTVALTGPGAWDAVLKTSNYLHQAYFKELDAGGDSIRSRPATIRRASF